MDRATLEGDRSGFDVAAKEIDIRNDESEVDRGSGKEKVPKDIRTPVERTSIGFEAESEDGKTKEGWAANKLAITLSISPRAAEVISRWFSQKTVGVRPLDHAS